MTMDYTQFEQRKQDHIALALLPDNQAHERNRLDTIHLTHEALPDINFDEIDIQTTRFGIPIPTPFLISSMTAGHHGAMNINRLLLEACVKHSWAMGVGSQRRELTDPDAQQEWSILRRDFPHATLFSNLGIAQIIHTPITTIQRIIDNLDASALIIHCNPLQESIQPEGTPLFKGCWQALENLVKQLSVPLIVKETGCGFSPHTLLRLNQIGVAAVDVSGLGGTHWGRIEGHRAAHDPVRQSTAVTFSNWGIDTVSSVCNAIKLKPNYEVWGSGGVRHGLDAAKLLALGASTIGFAKPMLDAAVNSFDTIIARMTSIEYELKVAMFCTGSRTLSELKEKVCR